MYSGFIHTLPPISKAKTLNALQFLPQVQAIYLNFCLILQPGFLDALLDLTPYPVPHSILCQSPVLVLAKSPPTRVRNP